MNPSTASPPIAEPEAPQKAPDHGWFPRLTFALFLGALAALWLHFQPLSPDASGYQMELDIVSPKSGSTWLQYDIGRGLNYQDRRNFWVTESAQPHTYRVALPSAVFRSFAILSPSTVHQVLAGARILAPDGTVAARIPAIRDVPGRDVIVIQLAQPLPLLNPNEKSWVASVLDLLVCAGVVFLISEFLRRRGREFEDLDMSRRISVWANAHPRTTLFTAAILAVVVSCHPVLFFGKSFVSPNNGVLCLYDIHPTLPGAPAEPITPWNGSDINAVMWAHLPYSVVAHDAVFRDHELPLWNRYVMCGLTLIGQGQSMIGDPLYWLTVCAGGSSWSWDLRLILSKLLFCFGLGLVIWRATSRLGTAAVLGFSCAFLGYFSFRFNHPATFSVCYAPWILLCWLRLADAATLRRAGWWCLALLGANWIEFNSGTAKEASMLMLGLNGMGSLAVLFRIEPWPVRLRKIGLGALAGVLFLAISAPLWTVFMEALKNGYTIYDRPETNQAAPALLIGLFDDLFFRQLMEKEWHVDPALNFFVLLGVCWALVDVRAWWKSPIARAALFISAFAIAMAFGVVPASLISRLPLFKNIAHVDDVFIAVSIVPLFVLAGFGFCSCLEKLATPEVWRRGWITSLLLIGSLAALYFGTVQARPSIAEFGLRTVRPTEFSSFFVRYATALFAAIALLPWLIRGTANRREWRSVSILGAVVCFTILHFRHGQFLETKFGNYVVTPQQRVDLQAHSATVDFLRDHQTQPARVMGFGQNLRPGFNMVERLETPTGADAVTARDLAQWYEAAGLGGISMWWPDVTKENIAAVRPFYDALNVRYYLGSIGDADRAAPGLEKIASSDLEIFASRTAWPRAFFTDRLSQYDDVRAFLQAVKNGDGRPFAAVQAGDADTPAPSPEQASRHIAAAHEYHLTANTTSFVIDAPSAGFVILNESFVARNFRAYLNGQYVPYFRVNETFKGVALPAAGTYRVEFAYWPHQLTATLSIAAAGLVIVLAAAGFLGFGPRRDDAAA